jgi:hypothetical protein
MGWEQTTTGNRLAEIPSSQISRKNLKKSGALKGAREVGRHHPRKGDDREVS